MRQIYATRDRSIIYQMNIFPKLKRKNTKIVKSLLALLNRLQWAENEQCAKHLINIWAEQYVVYDWIRLYAHCDTTRRNSLSAILRNTEKGYSYCFLALCTTEGHFSLGGIK